MELMAQLGKREKIKEGPLSTFIWHKNAAAENGKTENACMLIQTNLACACVPKGSSWRRAGGGEEGGKRGILETKKKRKTWMYGSVAADIKEMPLAAKMQVVKQSSGTRRSANCAQIKPYKHISVW